MLSEVRLGGREKEFGMGHSIQFLAVLVGALEQHVWPMTMDTQKSISRCMELVVPAA